MEQSGRGILSSSLGIGSAFGTGPGLGLGSGAGAGTQDGMPGFRGGGAAMEDGDEQDENEDEDEGEDEDEDEDRDAKRRRAMAAVEQEIRSGGGDGATGEYDEEDEDAEDDRVEALRPPLNPLSPYPLSLPGPGSGLPRPAKNEWVSSQWSVGTFAGTGPPPGAVRGGRAGVLAARAEEDDAMEPL